ncbi:MAG TPA: adenylate/guanylate cyclase domain-containing protein [Mycobacteriales bacterium]|nr:adenylate/guanylate cyclase domain-containing protein [Mycobacteriales bacterium]
MADKRRANARAAAARVANAARGVNRRQAAIDAVRRLRRALPGDPGFGDPLSAAGADSAAMVARLADRLFDEAPRVTHEAALGVLQLWHAGMQRVGRGQQSSELTLLFTDVVSFSAWALQAGDEAALVLLRELAKAQEPAVLAHRGRVVKRLGDGLMAAFPSPQLAFDAVVDARERLELIEVAGFRPVIRAGLHTGRPQVIGGDYLGVDVNVTARLMQRAGAGETLVSETTLAGLDPEQVNTRRKKTFVFTRTKGVPDDLAVYVASPRAPG